MFGSEIGVGRFFEMVEERFGRRIANILLAITAAAVAIGALHLIVTLGIRPIVDAFRPEWIVKAGEWLPWLTPMATAALAAGIAVFLTIRRERAKRTGPIVVAEVPVSNGANIQAPVKRDKNVSEALAYIALGNWGGSAFDVAGTPDTELDEALKEFRQAAVDGEVKIWGRKTADAPFQEIPSEFWVDGDIEWFDMLKHEPRTEPRGQRQASDFFDLMTSSSQVEARWPPKVTVSSPPPQESSGLAKLTWREGNGGKITNPWVASVHIEFERGAESVSCLVRVGKWTQFLGGDKIWKWSDQVRVFGPEQVIKGDVRAFTVAEVPVGAQEVEIFGNTFGGLQNHAAKVRVELVIGTTRGSQKETRTYGLPAREKFEPILIDESAYEERSR